jgi:hypothetical protein
MTSSIKVQGTILSGETTSNEINFSRSIPQAIILPSAFTGATITFTNSPHLDGTHRPVRLATLSAAATTTTSYSITVTGNTSAQIPLDPNVARGLSHAKVVSASAEGADRTIIFICREGDSVQ